MKLQIQLKKYMSVCFMVVCVCVISFSSAIPVKAFDDFYSDTENQFYDPNACDPRGGGDTAPVADSANNVTYKAMGNIPESGRDAQATVYGTQGEKDSNGKYKEYLGGIEGGAKDERGANLKGQTALAEMHSNSALGSLPYGAKVEVTYKEKAIIAVVVDNGPAGASDIDVWRQTADLLDLPYGNTKVKIRGVASNTEITPVSSSADRTPSGSSCCSESDSGSSSISLPSSIPKYWRDLISNAASKHTNTDPRLVAATLWAENRGWPDPDKNWGVSGAGAQGPWQFIPSSWASMGQDGDKDGVKDPNNPKDAVHAAYIHLAGSKRKPLVPGFTGSAQSYYDQAKFKRDAKNLLSFAASYNGSGAPDNTLLKDFPRNENSDYVKMVYWLIGTNFSKVWSPEQNKLIKVSTDAGSGSSDLGDDECSSEGSGDGAEVVRIAKKQYSKNKGILEYGGDIGKYTQGNQEPWCADFVSWVYKSAGRSFQGGTSGWRYPAVVTLKAYFDDKHEFFRPGEKTPEPGDVAFYIGAETPDGGSAEHVNIVISVDGNKMTTIGGNESDQIMRGEREIKLGSQSLAGFGRFKD